MAANGVRRTLQFSSASAKTLLTRLTTSTPKSKGSSFTRFSSKPSSPTQLSIKNLHLSRLPVELGGVLSLMPLHSVTASALFISLLSLHNNTWGCLSEGFAMPL